MDKRLLEKDILVFDVGNVLIRFNREYIARRSFPEKSFSRLYDAVFASGLWHLIDTGLMASGQLARLMCEAAHTQSQEDYLAIVDLLDGFYQYEHALKASEWLPELKKLGKKLYYLSNYGEPMFTKTMERFPFFNLFDGGVVSAREFVCKPARRIYDILAERYGFSPKDALFIDDTPENCEGAVAAGYSAWCYGDGLVEPVPND